MQQSLGKFAAWLFLLCPHFARTLLFALAFQCSLHPAGLTGGGSGVTSALWCLLQVASHPRCLQAWGWWGPS